MPLDNAIFDVYAKPIRDRNTLGGHGSSSTTPLASSLLGQLEDLNIQQSPTLNMVEDSRDSSTWRLVVENESALYLESLIQSESSLKGFIIKFRNFKTPLGGWYEPKSDQYSNYKIISYDRALVTKLSFMIVVAPTSG